MGQLCRDIDIPVRGETVQSFFARRDCKKWAKFVFEWTKDSAGTQTADITRSLRSVLIGLVMLVVVVMVTGCVEYDKIKKQYGCGGGGDSE